MSAAVERPVLKLTRHPLEVVFEAVAFLGVVLTFVLVGVCWPTLPERIPHHFDFSGRPDAWGGRWVLWLLPAIAAGLYVLLSAIARVPHRFNYLWPITQENAGRQYRIARTLLNVLKLEVVLLFGYLTWRIIDSARQGYGELGRGFLPLVIGVLAVTIAAHIVAAHRAR